MRRVTAEKIATALVAGCLLTAQACSGGRQGATSAATATGGGNSAGEPNGGAAGANVGAGGGAGTGNGVGGSVSATSAGAQATAGDASTSDGGRSTGAAGAPAAGASAAGASAAGASAAGASGAGGTANSCGSGVTAALPARGAVLSAMRLSNDYFMQKWPDPSVAIVTDKSRPSNIWTRAVYYEGLMALYAVDADAARNTSYYNYAVSWGASASHPWQLAGGGTVTRSADDQCCGQTYLDLYQIDPQAVRAHDIKADIDTVVAGASNGDWTWVDAIQMAMPVFAKLGVIYDSSAYFEKMHALYVNAKTTQGFYNPSDHLWWRDATFEPPFKTPNGKQCYWSRGNGWVFAALTRALDITPASAPYRAEYSADLQAMAAALAAVQRADGFWNVSLADPNDYGGPELTGTALFTYGMAWGIRQGLLDRATYEPVVSRAWCALASAVHPNGFLGFAQGSGSKPADGQPVSFDSVPDFQDFPTGCFLLGASEVWKLSAP
jgi:unsaturated rhamnogalacturonyl hydrolase